MRDMDIKSTTLFYDKSPALNNLISRHDLHNLHAPRPSLLASAASSSGPRHQVQLYDKKFISI